MKTIILYATKHGATQEAARRISDRIEGSEIHDLKQENVPEIADYDCIILGSSIYASRIRKDAKEFLSQNAETLKEKNLGLFLCGMEGEQEKEFFKINFPNDILDSARATCFLGGIFDPEKASALDRMIMKVVTKKLAYMDTIDNDKIEEFVKELTS